MSDPLAVVVICARPESRRVPNKVFLKLAGRTVVEHCVLRARDTGFPVVLAVPKGYTWAFKKMLSKDYSWLSFYEGDDDSPLHRTAGALSTYPGARYVVRITCDDPFIDAQSIKELVAACEVQNAVYGATADIVKGGGSEVVLAGHWRAIAQAVKIRTEMSRYFILAGVPQDRIIRPQARLAIRRPYRLELDYHKDATLLSILFGVLGPDAALDEACAYLDSHSYLLAINRLPKLSFYTCTYNAEKFIDRTVMSIFNCGLPVDEYVIVDNASMDKTLSHLGAYAACSGVKLLFNDHNEGLAASANRAVAECRVKWVMRVDADDVLLPDTTQFLIEHAEHNQADIVYPAYHDIDADGRYLAPGDPAAKHHAGCALMRREFLQELRFKDGIMLGDSAELYERARHVGKIEYLNLPTWLYRRHGASLTAAAK